MHKASSFQCIHYADDTTMFSKGNNLDDLIDFANTELVKMDKWVCSNKLSLNTRGIQKVLRQILKKTLEYGNQIR